MWIVPPQVHLDMRAYDEEEESRASSKKVSRRVQRVLCARLSTEVQFWSDGYASIKPCLNHFCLKGCKWSSLSAPGTETPLSHSILRLDDFPFPIISPLG